MFLALFLALASTGLRPHKTSPQSTLSSRLSFEVASIKPTRIHGVNSIQISPSGERFTTTNVQTEQLIEWAYGLRPEQLSGGPNWLDTDTYDIEAKVDDVEVATMKNFSREDRRARVQLMLQSLLEDRFQMRIRRETKELSTTVLTIAKGGSKLSPSTASPSVAESAQSISASTVGISFIQGVNGKNGIEGHQASVASLARAISLMIRAPVADQTGLRGDYDFKLEWPATPMGDESAQPSNTLNSGIYSVIEKQLGLKLDVRKVPLPTIVIEHIERPSPD